MALGCHAQQADQHATAPANGMELAVCESTASAPVLVRREVHARGLQLRIGSICPCVKVIELAGAEGPGLAAKGTAGGSQRVWGGAGLVRGLCGAAVRALSMAWHAQECDSGKRVRRTGYPCHPPPSQCTARTHSVPEQGRVTGSTTRLVALVSLVLPKLHLLNRPPTVVPLGLLSANTAARTCCAVYLMGPLPGQVLPAAPAERTARGTTRRYRQAVKVPGMTGHSSRKWERRCGQDTAAAEAAPTMSGAGCPEGEPGHSLGMKTVGTSAPIS